MERHWSTAVACSALRSGAVPCHSTLTYRSRRPWQVPFTRAAMTSCKEAIKDIEVDGKVAAEMEEVRLCPIAMMKPLITKMDASLSGIKKCKQLRMSSNSIQKIEGLAGMDSLQVLGARGRRARARPE